MRDFHIVHIFSDCRALDEWHTANDYPLRTRGWSVSLGRCTHGDRFITLINAAVDPRGNGLRGVIVDHVEFHGVLDRTMDDLCEIARVVIREECSR